MWSIVHLTVKEIFFTVLLTVIIIEQENMRSFQVIQ